MGNSIPVWLASLSLSLTAGAAFAQDGLAEARALMERAMGPLCMSDVIDASGDKRFEFRFRYSYETQSDPEHVAVLYRLGCTAGAYNLVEAYVLANEYDEMSLVAFAEPELDIRYVNGDFEGDVESMRISGFTANLTLVNSEVDAATRTITSNSRWRGLGDAWSSGTWRFHEGRFVLVTYEVDATYDGELEGVVVYEAGG